MANDEELQDELNCFFISAGRHDKDRVELQFGFDGLISAERNEFSYIVETALFVPKSLGMSNFESTIRQDFQSYVRLHTHVSNPESQSSFARVDERLRQLKQNLTDDTLRNFAIDFQGFLKANDKKIRKIIKDMISSARTDSTLSQALSIEIEIKEVLHLLEDFRSVLKARHIDTKQPEDVLDRKLDHDLILLNEYISHLLVQYVGDLYSLTIGVDYLQNLAAFLTDLSRQEAHMRAAHNYIIDERTNPKASRDFDKYPRRISILKKYFQSPLFVQDSSSPLEKRLLIPVYAMAAAMAATWAIMVQLYQFQTIEQRVGINSIAIISMGVAAYVAKDLLKDYMRRFLMRKSGRWFPDESRKLFLVNKNKRTRLGKIGESIKILNSEKLPEGLKKARYSTANSRLEEALGEDVLHIKKRVDLDLNKLDHKKEFPWGFREIIRLRVDRYLTQMDDAYKKMYFVSRNGFPSQKQTHRIYQLHLATWIRAISSDASPTPVRPAFKAFLLTLDKSGILACDPLVWEKNGVPPPPSATHLKEGT